MRDATIPKHCNIENQLTSCVGTARGRCELARISTSGSLKEKPVSETNPIRVFVTHAFQESDDYLRVFEFLESADRFFYLNVSKPENIPPGGGIDAIKQELIDQIKQSEAIIALSSVYSEKENLVRFELDVAAANHKPIIAIRPYGHIGETPEDLVMRAEEHIEWNDREIVDALRRQARGEDTARWETIDFPGWDEHGEISDKSND